jgi:hypothetical protein
MQRRCDRQVRKGIAERDADRLSNVRLRDSKVSFGEAGLNPRGVILLPRNILHSLQVNTRKRAGQRMNPAVCNCRVAETAGFNRRGPKAKQANLELPCFCPEAVYSTVWVAATLTVLQSLTS